MAMLCVCECCVCRSRRMSMFFVDHHTIIILIHLHDWFIDSLSSSFSIMRNLSEKKTYTGRIFFCESFFFFYFSISSSSIPQTTTTPPININSQFDFSFDPKWWWSPPSSLCLAILVSVIEFSSFFIIIIIFVFFIFFFNNVDDATKNAMNKDNINVLIVNISFIEFISDNIDPVCTQIKLYGIKPIINEKKFKRKRKKKIRIRIGQRNGKCFGNFFPKHFSPSGHVLLTIFSNFEFLGRNSQLTK